MLLRFVVIPSDSCVFYRRPIKSGFSQVWTFIWFIDLFHLLNTNHKICLKSGHKRW